MTINFPEQSYRDGFELGREEFYRLLTSAEKLPTTRNRPRRLSAGDAGSSDDGGVVVITISSGMSGTYERVIGPGTDRPERAGCGFDSRTASLGQGL